MSSNILHKALFQKPLNTNAKVQCILCPHACILKEDDLGLCKVRQNHGGILYALAYKKISSIALDPIEKKPLYHFFPGSKILSVGSYGCNMSCLFCQNHEISQSGVPLSFSDPLNDISPEALVQKAVEAQRFGSIGLAYTYNEPFTNFEYMYECAQLIHKKGLINVIVSNGFVLKDPLFLILPFIHAVNIDIKAFTPNFYQTVCKARLDPVLDTITTIVKIFPHVHIELTTLIIPGYNSSKQEINALAQWIAALSPDIPLHVSRHHPAWKMQEPESIKNQELLDLVTVAKKSLRFVYPGNLTRS